MKIISFIACEDVRQERDGKTTIVGMYDGLLLAPDALADGKLVALRFASHLRFQLEDGDTEPNRIEITIAYNGDNFGHGDVRFVVSDRAKPIQLAGPMVLHNISQPGALSITYRFFRDDEQLWEPAAFSVDVGVRQASA
jgi:hypothetical protein